ncbi:MAG: geranylgeranyl reductase family protein [Bacteroidota bacterium]
MSREYDIIIVGSGPAGTSAAIQLAQSGLKIALLDQATFPRDKICGDALSVDVINQLSMLSPKLANEFGQLASKTPSQGVTIYAPNGKSIDIAFVNQGKHKCGYIVPRKTFDDLLFRQVNSFSNIHCFENRKVTSIKRIHAGVEVSGHDFALEGKFIIGADGAHSVVNRYLGKVKVDKNHYSAGLRMYYENVQNFYSGNYIELYFFKDILPGYLWVFPLANNRANVGIGMLSSALSAKKVNLKASLQSLLDTHPLLYERFKTAKPLETAKGFGLPLGSKKRSISGDRFLLTGDAAGLIDPFSGEGIANAIRSGRVAAEHTLSCFELNDFSAQYNKAYDKEIYRRMWKELKVSRTLQNLCRYPKLFNFVVSRARESKYLTELLTQALAEVDVKKVLTKPGFYLKLLIR